MTAIDFAFAGIMIACAYVTAMLYTARAFDFLKIFAGGGEVREARACTWAGAFWPVTVSLLLLGFLFWAVRDVADAISEKMVRH